MYWKQGGGEGSLGPSSHKHKILAKKIKLGSEKKFSNWGENKQNTQTNQPRQPEFIDKGYPTPLALNLREHMIQQVHAHQVRELHHPSQEFLMPQTSKVNSSKKILGSVHL